MYELFYILCLYRVCVSGLCCLYSDRYISRNWDGVHSSTPEYRVYVLTLLHTDTHSILHVHWLLTTGHSHTSAPFLPHKYSRY